MSEFLGYSKNNIIDKSLGFIHKNVFKDQINLFKIEGYEIVFLTKEEIDKINSQKSLDEQKIKKIAECQNYLNKTDWYIVRMSDPKNGTIIPEHISANRVNARIFQSKINNSTTLEELNNINTDFS